MRLHKDIVAVLIFCLFGMAAGTVLLAQVVFDIFGLRKLSDYLDLCGAALCRALAWALEFVE